MKFEIPENIARLLSLLRKAGFRALPVGGCVRDLLLGSTPYDWDIATCATPDEMLLVFSGLRALSLGRAATGYGTVTVVLEGANAEVTTFRLDGAYSDGRRPDSVRFSKKLEDDLARRDFTINAMCLDEDNEIIDLFGGMQDLKSGIIRAIGVPERRFEEDALRILRALRFAAVLNFEIEPRTKAAMLKCAGRIFALSAERIRAELEKLICAEGCTGVLLRHADIIFAVLPELERLVDDESAEKPCGSRYRHAANAAGAAPPDVAIRFALLLGALDRPVCRGNKTTEGSQPQGAKAAGEVLRRLKFSNATKRRVLFIVENFDIRLECIGTIEMKKLLSARGAGAVSDLLKARRAYVSALQNWPPCRLECFEKAEQLINGIISGRTPLKTNQLAISGRELVSAGIEPGPAFKPLLEAMLQKVIEETLPNEPEALLEFAKQQYRIFKP